MKRDPKKKCITKRCEDCHFFKSWDFTNDNGLRKTMKKCSLDVLCEEIPHLRGSVDGCQEATNETRNKVESFGTASVETLKSIADNAPRLLKLRDK